ncbi:MAG: PDZ domain-containing protein [Planctomycetota bacterium]
MRRTALLLCVVGPWTWLAPAAAKAPPEIPRGSLAHMVPENTGVYVELLRLKQSDEQLRRANLWSAAQLLLGGKAERAEQAFDWRTLVRENLGVAPQAAATEIFGYRVAVAAPSWERLADAVIVAWLRDAKSLDSVIGRRRAKLKRRYGPVRSYLTITGLWVATDGRVAAFSRSAQADSLFAGVVDLLSNGKTKPLSERAEFVEQVGQLTRGYAGCLYFPVLHEQGGPLARALPAFASAAVGMYVRGDRLDFEVRATLQQPRSATHRPLIEMRRLERLPHSTLLAWASSVDLPAAYRGLIEGKATGVAGRYVALFRAALDLEEVRRDIVAKLGPRMILLWDRLRGRNDVPQVAVMFESTEPRNVARSLADAFARLAGSLRRTPEAGEGVTRARHLDTEILSVSLAGLLPGGAQGSPASMLISAMEPSFAALDGWVVAATSPAQLRQVVAAHEGWIPTLGSMEDLQADRWRMSHNAVVLAVAQPAMAAAVAASWEATGDAASANRFARLFGSQPRNVGRAQQRMLGIGIRKDPVSGEVVVARVRAKRPAIGKLRVGDQILGVDGRLLDLADPVADLRGKIAECADPTGLTLRVRRGEELLDVVVPMPHAIPVNRPPSQDPADALRQLQALGRALTYAVYSVARCEPDQFHARISFRLASVESAGGRAPAGRK